MTADEPTQTRRSVLRKGAIAAGGLALGGIVFTGSATADKGDLVEDFTGVTLFNPCTEEAATFTSGKLLFDSDVREDTNGGLHVNLRLFFYGRLEGEDTGLKYEASQTFSRQEYIAPGGAPKTIRRTGNVKFISQGSASNFHGRLRVRMTVNANDVTVVDVEIETLPECR